MGPQDCIAQEQADGCFPVGAPRRAASGPKRSRRFVLTYCDVINARGRSVTLLRHSAMSMIGAGNGGTEPKQATLFRGGFRPATNQRSACERSRRHPSRRSTSGWL
jgi:hypothetical protein